MLRPLFHQEVRETGLGICRTLKREVLEAQACGRPASLKGAMRLKRAIGVFSGNGKQASASAKLIQETLIVRQRKQLFVAS